MIPQYCLFAFVGCIFISPVCHALEDRYICQGLNTPIGNKITN